MIGVLINMVTNNVKLAIIGAWLFFHFLFQLYAPINHIAQLAGLTSKNHAGGPKQIPVMSSVVYFYLRNLNLFQSWALYATVSGIGAWTTVESGNLRVETPLGFFKSNLNTREFNYFQYRFRTVLSYMSVMSVDPVIQFVGKSVCNTHNLSGNVQVNYYRRYFNFENTPVNIETKKITSTVSCKGPVVWPG